MRDGQRKFDLLAKLDTYIQHVCINPTDLHPKYNSGWEVASQLGCPHVTIDRGSARKNVIFSNGLWTNYEYPISLKTMSI